MDTPIASIIQQRPIFVNSTDSLSHTLHALVENKIHSVPVFDVEKQSFVAFVDLMDFAMHLGKTYLENQVIEGSITRMLEEERHYNTIQIANESNRDPWVTVNDLTTFHQVVNVMLTGRLHRVAVFNDENQLCGVFTQRDAIRFLAQHPKLLGDLLQQTVRQLNLGVQEVISVEEGTQAWKAFILMNQKQVSGVAVVEPKTGKLKGNISSADLKAVDFNKELMQQLRSTVSEYLTGRSHHEMSPAGTVHLGDTVATVIQNFVTSRKHRLFIMDEQHPDGHAVGVITLSDVLRLVFNLHTLSGQ